MTTATHASFPRIPLIGAASLIAIAVALAIFGRLAAPIPAPPAVPLAHRDLVFSDRADGAVVITEVGQSEPLTVVTGQAGFLRGIMRALARQRRLDRLGPGAPFRLSAWPDGRLTLDDTADGGRVDLEAFGPDNEVVFARLLGMKEKAQ
jgi:putative photosynthetic complex assembly protein